MKDRAAPPPSPGARRPAILYVADSLACGGSERQLVELACEMHRRGSRVAVLSYRPGDFFAGRLEAAGIEWIFLPRGGWNDLRFFHRLRSTLRRFDLVHPFRPRPCTWAALAARTLPAGERPTLVAAERSWGPDDRGAIRRLYRWAFRQAAAVTVNNATAGRRMAELVDRPGSRIELIGNGIDLARWDAAAAAACPLPLAAERFHLALIGSVRPEKNQLLLVEALARIPPPVRSAWRLWLIGDSSRHPEYRQRLDRAVADKGLAGTVRWSPALTDIAPVMRRLDGIVTPSRREGFPNVVLEAMASRLPVIGARVGALPELVEEGGTGLLVEGYAPAAWAEAMTRLAGLTPGEREAMGRRARSRVEAELQMSQIGARYSRLYDEL